MQDSPTPDTPRLEILFARERPVALILKRSPRRWIQFLRWDLECDEIEPGSWLHTRLRPRYCDLSPDGRLFVYKSLRHDQWNHWNTVVTAVCRPPWATALVGWTSYKGEGGGRFDSNRCLVTHIHSPTSTIGSAPEWLTIEQQPLYSGDSTIDKVDATWVSSDGRRVEYRDGVLSAADPTGAMRSVARFERTEPQPCPSPPDASEWPSEPRERS
ncbi:MAG: hypothetical protein KDC38_19190 [Planctomycetes bacterium]|nr:hypothetical protein [Planctomycetota bacterium]